MAQQWAATPGGKVSDDHADVALIDIFGIEGSITPFEHLVVILVPGIGHGFQKRLETADAADIVGRCAAGSADEGRVVSLVFTLPDAVQDNVMPPVVAEIVDVKKAINPALDQRLEADALRFNTLRSQALSSG